MPFGIRLPEPGQRWIRPGDFFPTTLGGSWYVATCCGTGGEWETVCECGRGVEGEREAESEARRLARAWLARAVPGDGGQAPG